MVVLPHDQNFLKKSSTKLQGVMLGHSLGLYDICGSEHHFFFEPDFGDHKLV